MAENPKPTEEQKAKSTYDLTLEFVDEVIAWLKENRDPRGWDKCPVCDESDWTVMGPVGLPHLIVENYPETVFPAVPLVCRTCGNVQFLSLSFAQIGPPPGLREIHPSEGEEQ